MKNLSPAKKLTLFIGFNIVLALCLVAIQNGRHDDGNYVYINEKDYKTYEEFQSAVKEALTDDVNDAVYTVPVEEYMTEEEYEEYKEINGEPSKSEDLSNPTEPITKHLLNKLEDGNFTVDENKIEDTSETTPFFVDASNYKSDAHLKNTVSSALIVFDSVTVINLGTGSGAVKKSDEDYAIATKHPNNVLGYEARNVRDLGLTFEGDSVDGSTNLPDCNLSESLVTGVDVYNNFKLGGKSYDMPYAFSQLLFGSQIEMVTCGGSWEVPEKHDGKEVKRATLQTREVMDNKEVDLYKKGSDTVADTVKTQSLYGVNFYKVFEYK